MSGCNNCHDALATTFHTPDRGGNVVVCRLCHITKAAGSHLELQSRSIDSYAHAIHRFQDFDTGSIDFTDPVEAMEYTHHVESNFPTFGIEDCRACHNAGKFNVPNQGLSLPGVLSNTDFGTIRNIGTIHNDVITGPATRACGACHRAEAIIANAGFGDPIQACKHQQPYDHVRLYDRVTTGHDYGRYRPNLCIVWRQRSHIGRAIGKEPGKKGPSGPFSPPLGTEGAADRGGQGAADRIGGRLAPRIVDSPFTLQRRLQRPPAGGRPFPRREETRESRRQG